MNEAATQLAPGDRHLLWQHFVAGLSIEQLGAVLGIDREVASRRIARAREKLLADAREALARRLGSALYPEHIDELVRHVATRFEVLVGKLLARAGTRP
jgi:RNA polymerase sigma-70 factor (ECF subfamily)